VVCPTEGDREASIRIGPWPTSRCCAVEMKKICSRTSSTLFLAKLRLIMCEQDTTEETTLIELRLKCRSLDCCMNGLSTTWK
jgi:hypothetical protein